MKALLDIRWVCAVCLKVIREPLKITKRWIGNGVPRWEIITAVGPQCHGQDMLIAGEPKIDRWGQRGPRDTTLIDPVDNLRIKVAT